MRDERVERVDKAERLLEAIGTLLLDGSPPANELWPITAFSLASHARSHHRALLEGLLARWHAQPSSQRITATEARTLPERAKGIEPSPPAWKAGPRFRGLPLSWA